MRPGLFIPIAFFFMVACRNKNRIPSSVLSQQKMQSVMWDMMRADHFLTDYVFPKDSAVDKVAVSFKYYQRIFDIHRISKEQFQKSYLFYTSHPALFKIMMDSLSKAPEAAPAEVMQPVAVEDSIPASLTQPLQRADTVIRLQRKKGVSLQ